MSDLMDAYFQMPPVSRILATAVFVTSCGVYIYSYVSQLEKGNPRFAKQEDLIWYLAFVSTTTLIFDTALGFNSGFYLQGLILALAYTVTQDQRGIKANFFFVTIPAQLVPYAMMLASLLMVGPAGIMLQLCGLAAAHLYDFLTRIWPEFGGGRNYLTTPAFVSRLLVLASRTQQQSFGTAIRGAGTGAATTSGGGGPLPDAWRTRGRGQRLGGD
ncbi:centromere microtubule-binding protein cbf5 [Grosmannia clavigera kw1407]|uniref:Derlin n=1 Tax=Grosmannia clavigera (strain kw1407 / UAMH 11150) TaxID=655863 RepID=F0XRA5_GROCL|nr:centromere microtubule-binding protein cbf5 [Grosmannia clavigera kw1407]EFW99976.1 centromere microtubule-binding protein cbf5 [Grosmannia clavigera kw1407]